VQELGTGQDSTVGRGMDRWIDDGWKRALLASSGSKFPSSKR
jgi:hypothetical protein